MNTPQPVAPDRLAERLSAAGRELLAAVAGLDGAALAAPSVLPGWSRSFVVAHLEGVARAITRQIDYAARGERVEFYDGGFDGRTRDIELRAQRPAEEQLLGLTDAVSGVVAAFAGVTGDRWEGRIAYRDGTVYDGALALWRELVIHTSDLDLGRTSREWDRDFCLYLLTFLAARVPAGLTLDLRPLGGQPLSLANESDAPDRTVTVTGMLQDIAAWLAGREPQGELTATVHEDAVELPELLPWPAAVAPRP